MCFMIQEILKYEKNILMEKMGKHLENIVLGFGKRAGDKFVTVT